MQRQKVLIALGLTPIGLGMAALIFWLAAPLVVDQRVDEAFPTSAALAEPSAMMAEPTTMMAEPTAMMAEPSAMMAEPTAMMAEPSPMPPPTQTVAPTQPSLPTETAQVDTGATTQALAATATQEVMLTTSALEQAATATAIAAEPVRLRSGSFTRIDALHSAVGQASIYRLPDGALILRLEEFDSQNGPDLYIGLSGHAMPRSNDELYAQGYLELARLKANQGNQNYELPADFDPDQYHGVVIYCKAFSVVFSTAALEL